jgi:tryptophanyl-tRNA synthetase
MKKRVFSGIQPSGVVHLGNYVGALKNWVAMQNEYDCLYCVVDLHAITVPQDPAKLKQNILLTAATSLAVGIDPEKSILFVQSDVPEHAELAWILNCFVYFGELSRMTQFKDKSTTRGQGTSVGLFTYPALMAADILLYGTHAVPVGDDQRQHLELTRDIARRMNGDYKDMFVIPEALIGKRGARVMGLDDPTVKMSKSATSEYNYISLLDTPDQIRKKCMKAVTDSEAAVRFDEEKKPAVSNLLTLYSALTNKSIDDIVNEYTGKGYGDFKKGLAEAVVAAVSPIQAKINDLLKNQDHIHSILKVGAEKARDLSRPAMAKVRATLGLGQ